MIIPVRNMAATLERAVMSAVDADEIHVVDDASTDDTQAVVSRLPIKVVYWRWPRKAKCHLEAQRVVWQSIDCQQIVGVGADDALLPGFLDAVRRHADSATVFTDYDVVSVTGERLWTVSQDCREVLTLTPQQMRTRLQVRCNATESGIGSSVRVDVAACLWERGWQRLGPHMDSVGMAAAASEFGATILPMVGAAYTMTERSYGRDALHDHDQARHLGAMARDWLRAWGIDEPTVRAICRKRCGVVWN